MKSRYKLKGKYLVVLFLLICLTFPVISAEKGEDETDDQPHPVSIPLQGSVSTETDVVNHWCHWSYFNVTMDTISPAQGYIHLVVKDKVGNTWTTLWEGDLSAGQTTPTLYPSAYNADVYTCISNSDFEIVYYWGIISGEQY